MRTATLLLPLALAAAFASAPLMAASATPTPATATRSQLHLQTFHPGPQAMFSVSSVLIEGRRDAILVDAQFGASDARKLVELIRASGKQLTTIYISHSDPDYYFGLATLQDAFRRHASSPLRRPLPTSSRPRPASWPTGGRRWVPTCRRASWCRRCWMAMPCSWKASACR